MEGFPKCPQLLDLIPRGEDWFSKRVEDEQTRNGFSEEKKLELSLGPPGGEWNRGRSLFSRSTWQEQYRAPSSFLHLQTGSVMKETSQTGRNRVESLQGTEKKAFSAAKNTASSAQKRIAPAPVVGWPPIRSFRKNIASGSSPKLCTESPDVGPEKASEGPKSAENGTRSMFVKINMDGVPIGRKVDLKTNGSYDKLSYAVDELFRGLLAAQSELSAGGMKDKKDDGKVIGCLLDGSGEYTLVYEDNDGDRMLVGDVPWHMFVSTVKRLRVLKSSELSSLPRGSKQGKLSHRA